MSARRMLTPPTIRSRADAARPRTPRRGLAVAAMLVTAAFSVMQAPRSVADGGAGAAVDRALAAYRGAQETTSAAERRAAFTRAERLMRAAADAHPDSAALWSNVGTAALQAEHVGAAVLAFRRALALDPDQRRAQQNLTHARRLLPSWVPTPEQGGLLDGLLSWQHAMSPAERRGAAALAFALAGAMIGGALATGSAPLRLFAFAPIAAWAVLLVAGLAAPGGRDGVLAGTDTVARAADSRNAPARFAEPLPAGTEVTIAETRGAWRRILLADGRDAWVPTSSVESVRPAAPVAPVDAAHPSAPAAR